jgi:hypothetical protein
MAMRWLRIVAGLGLLTGGQTAGIATASGTDAGTGVAYALISVEGKVVGAPIGPLPPQVAAMIPAAATTSDAQPRLTAQCTKDTAGALKFELFADMGGVGTLAYHPPWKPTPQMQVQPPIQSVMMTTQFLGYTKIKPLRLGWTYLRELPGEMRYATPGFHSANMESEKVFVQYLRALPTVRMTIVGRGTVEFETSGWQTAVKAEPLCGASGL